jgi:hypothetical protein
MAAAASAVAAGAVFHVTLDSDQLELTAARNSPPLSALSLAVAPTVSRSFAPAIAGQPVPLPVPATVPARGLEWRVPGALTSAADAQVSTRCADM